MEYAALVDVYDRLAATDSNHDKRDVLAGTFADAGDMLPRLVTLVRGRLGPAYDRPELGVSSSLTMEATLRATGAPEGEVRERWKETGDLGDAAAWAVEHGGQQTLFSEDLTVERVHDRLREVATFEGEGSQDRKVDALAGLIADADPNEARYVVRTALGHMRVGVGEGTIRDAVAHAFLDGSGDAIAAVERAFQVTTDFRVVAETAREDGLEGLAALDVELGRPVQLMLAEKAEDLRSGLSDVTRNTGNGTTEDPDPDGMGRREKVRVETKYDGIRCVSGFTRVYTEESGVTVIRDIDVGDKVLTHTGSFREVLGKSKRTVDAGERIFELSTYLGHEFKITEGHEILVSEGGETEWVPVEELSDDQWVGFPIPTTPTSRDPPDVLELSTPGNYTKEFEFGEEFFRFLGYWVGDGSTNTYNGNQRVELMFNNDHDRLWSEYKDIVVSELGISPDRIGEYDHGGATSMYWTDRPFRGWLCENFRKRDQDGWRDKRLPEWFWNVSEAQFEAFLQGWFEADGHEDDYGRRTIVTKERYLATIVQLVGLRFGIVLGYSQLRRDDKTYYQLTITKNEKYGQVADGHVRVQILRKEELSRRSPREVDPRQTVYNLEVEGDQSYCAPMLALHNCQLHVDDEVRLFTRRLEEVTDQFPDVVRAVEEGVTADSALLDGELVGYTPETVAGPSEDRDPVAFQELSRRIKREEDVEAMAREVPVVVHPFDCLYDGEAGTLIDEPLADRLEHLAAAYEPVDPRPEEVIAGLEASAATWAGPDDPEPAEELYRRALEGGHEGLMVKNPAAAYEPGRRVGRLLKVKPTMEPLDLAVTRAVYSEGRRSELLGRLYLACYDADADELREIGRLSTGYTDEELAALTDRLEGLITARDGRAVDLRPEVVLEVEYEEIQESPEYGSGYALRFPRFLSVREDLAPEDADSLERVASLYDSQ